VKQKRWLYKYDTKLAIKGTFEDVMKVSVVPMRDLKKEPKKK
jgi:hypothetical protein